MDVTFSSAALAALCNSEQRLAQRWGPEVGRTVGRRLLDLAAADADGADRLPGAQVAPTGPARPPSPSATAIVIRGVISSGSTGRRCGATPTAS